MPHICTYSDYTISRTFTSARGAFSISAAICKNCLFQQQKKKRHFWDFNLKCGFGVLPCWHGSDLLIHTYSIYIILVNFLKLLSSRLLKMANFLIYLTYAYLCSHNKPVTLYLPITIFPFSIMTPEIMIKITIISSPLLHTSRDREEGAV